MALLDGQKTLALNTLYEIQTLIGISNIESQLQANLSVNSGSIDVYGTNSATQPTTLAEMTVEDVDTNISGVTAFSVLPRYIAFVQNTGSTTELIATGLRITNRGAIS